MIKLNCYSEARGLDINLECDTAEEFHTAMDRLEVEYFEDAEDYDCEECDCCDECGYDEIEEEVEELITDYVELIQNACCPECLEELLVNFLDEFIEIVGISDVDDIEDDDLDVCDCPECEARDLALTELINEFNESGCDCDDCMLGLLKKSFRLGQLEGHESTLLGLRESLDEYLNL